MNETIDIKVEQAFWLLLARNAAVAEYMQQHPDTAGPKLEDVLSKHVLAANFEHGLPGPRGEETLDTLELRDRISRLTDSTKTGIRLHAAFPKMEHLVAVHRDIIDCVNEVCDSNLKIEEADTASPAPM